MNRIHCYTLLLSLCFAPQLQAQIIEEPDSVVTIQPTEVEQDNTFARNDKQTTPPTREDITLPEGMLRKYQSHLNAWYRKEYMQLDTALLNAENPYYPTEVYVDRLRRLPCLIEMPHNDIVQQYIDQYTYRLRESVSFMIGALNFYAPIFEEALEAEGCPLELKYLPVVESALDPTAVSSVGAVGLWQFMVPTAKRFDLTVNSLLDERRDPIKSSKAAARYLRTLYDEFQDWTLAIAAYNCGENNVRKAIRRANGARDYWTIYPYLPRETRGYVPAFIAANYVMTNYCHHKIPPMMTVAPIETDTILVTRDLHLAQVASTCNISMEALEAMNPQYRTGLIPGYSQPCALRMPLAAIDQFIALGNSIYEYDAANYLTRRTLVVAEEPLPASLRSKPAKAESEARSRHARSKHKTKHEKRERHKSVKVRSGDTLSEIAQRNGTTVSKLRRLNRLSGNTIQPGAKIRVK